MLEVERLSRGESRRLCVWVERAGQVSALFLPMRSADYRRELAKQVKQARQIGDHHGICRLLPGEDYDEVTASLRVGTVP